MAADSLRKTSSKSKLQLRAFPFALLSHSFDDSPERFFFLFTKVFVDVK